MSRWKDEYETELPDKNLHYCRKCSSTNSRPCDRMERRDSFCARRKKLTVFIDRVSVPMVSIQGVAGQRAILPCNIQPREPNDAVTMVLWFRKDNGDPLYSYDARIRQYGKAKFWSATNVWGHRATFRASPPPAQLTIQDIRESDEGVYRCRVDFRNSPTRNFKVNFTVIEIACQAQTVSIQEKENEPTENDRRKKNERIDDETRWWCSTVGNFVWQWDFRLVAVNVEKYANSLVESSRAAIAAAAAAAARYRGIVELDKKLIQTLKLFLAKDDHGDLKRGFRRKRKRRRRGRRVRSKSYEEIEFGGEGEKGAGDSGPSRK
ncbi:hypothetical protein M0804_005285 [Polistes exclamans]|nr:hypothetical protein M0804_005285 [Polistes exclamans]